MRETFIPALPRVAYFIGNSVPVKKALEAGAAPPFQTGLTINRARTLDGLRLGGSFIAHWAQFDRAIRLAFLAPMPLGAGKPLPHSAVVAYEDFFSHAKEVLRRRGDVAKRCFPKP
jgi:hypothetical protein